MTKRTITLTGRPPVTIDDASWPLIASTSDKQHDGQVECQANRTSKWYVGVRQHADGRTIVYATYNYSTNWQNARDFHARHGVLLAATPTAETICKAIADVCDEMVNCECNGDDNQRWGTLADACIADMPAETLE